MSLITPDQLRLIDNAVAEARRFTAEFGPPDEDLELDRDKLRMQGFAACAHMLLGKQMGPALIAVMFGIADKPNGELAPEVTRAALSKWICRCKRNAGLPVENPKQARAGRKPREKPPAHSAG